MAQPGSQALARLEEAIVQARVRREAIRALVGSVQDLRHLVKPPHTGEGL